MLNNSLIEIMKNRRSIRAYTNESVKKEDIVELLKGAVLAPSGSNIQPWLFGIIDDRNILERIFSFSPGLGGNPPCIIVVCSNRKLAFEKGDKLGRDEMSIIDVSLATENIILLATERGIGTCVIKSFNEVAIRKILNLPEHISPDLIITVGYPKNQQKSPPKRKIEDVIFHNHWEEKVYE